MNRKYILLPTLFLLFAGCLEGKKPTPLRRAESSAPVELKTQPKLPDLPPPDAPKLPDPEPPKNEP